jgi:transcriptional regulator NrdR family protein
VKCPICNAWTEVKDTRVAGEFQTTRRRECANGHRFSTVELVKPTQEMIEEHDDWIRKTCLTS